MDIQEDYAKYLEIFNSCRIDITKELTHPKYVLQVYNNCGDLLRFGTLGNFTMLIGKAKAGKTYALSLFVSAFLNSDTLQNKIKGTAYNTKQVVLYFDTEQDDNDILILSKRICSLIGIDNPENLHVYGLRDYTPDERIKIIEVGIHNTENLGLVIIDGSRDVITSINDELQATDITCKYMKWTKTLQIHIITVLHQNKSDNNARGHVGSELINKAETVISITKDEKDENNPMFIIKSDQNRGKHFDSFAFQIDSDGLPYILEDWIPSQSGDSKQKAFKPECIRDQLHYDFISRTFEKQPEILPKDFKELIRDFIKSLNKDNPTGDTKIKEFVAYYKINNWVTKLGNEKDGKAPFIKFKDVF